MRKKITQNKKTVLTRLTSFLIAGSIIAAPICAVHATPTATQKNSSASTKTTQTIRKGSSTSAKTAQTTHKGSSASAKTTPAVKKGSSASAKTTQTTKKSSRTSSKSSLTKITISAAGDCTLGSDIKSPASVNFYAKYREKKNPSYFLKKVKPIFKRDDMTLVNFEGTLTNRCSENICVQRKCFLFENFTKGVCRIRIFCQQPLPGLWRGQLPGHYQNISKTKNAFCFLW